MSHLYGPTDHLTPPTTGRIAYYDIKWADSGPQQDPKARLLATVHIAGIPMHLEAYALAAEGDDVVIDAQAFVKLPDDAEYDFKDEEAAFWKLAGDQAVQTITIDGREYALVATPHGA